MKLSTSKTISMLSNAHNNLLLLTLVLVLIVGCNNQSQSDESETADTTSRGNTQTNNAPFLIPLEV